MICILGNDHDNSDDRESNIDFGDEDQFDPEVSAELEDAPSANEETDVPSANQEMMFLLQQKAQLMLWKDQNWWLIQVEGDIPAYDRN